jgi:imidazolonepropionase-like amidohydrolase
MTAREQRNRITAAWILGILLLLPGCQPAGKSAPGGLFTLEHGTLINPGAQHVPNANVVVANGRISCAGTASECPRPADSKPIDVNGTYVGRAHGAEAIKVWYIEVPDSVRPHAKAMILAAADESRKARLPLVVHATELQSSKDAVEAGAAVLVHEVFRDTVDGAWLAAVKRAGTIVVPTLSVLDGYADVMLARAPASRYPVDCVDRSTRQKLETVLPDSLRAKGAGFWRGPGAALRRTAAHNLQRTYSAGIPIAMGSDAGNPGTAHGPAVFAEMEAMQQAGMPAIAVFASATIQSARAMGLEREVGSIAAGKRADLVVFGADPTRDIRNARQVRWVMRNGVLRSRQELLETVSGER